VAVTHHESVSRLMEEYSSNSEAAADLLDCLSPPGSVTAVPKSRHWSFELQRMLRGFEVGHSALGNQKRNVAVGLEGCLECPAVKDIPPLTLPPALGSMSSL
jgi:hypothetical protein